MKITIRSTVVETMTGDITLLATDAIVNPANSALQLGGGVAGAIARRGGLAIQHACNVIGGTPVGTAVITTAGHLPSRHVIHAVGPRWGEGQEERKLKDATRAAVRIAAAQGLRSLAIPAISTGIFGYPLRGAASAIVSSVVECLEEGGGSLEHVVLCLFDAAAQMAFDAELAKHGAHGAPR